MAEILDGSSDLSSTAPLSQAQTVALVRHVQGEIRDVENAVEETNRNVQRAGENIQKLKDQQQSAHDDIHVLQIGSNETNLNLGKLENQVGRILEAVSRLQVSYENVIDQLTQLHEGKRMTDTRLDVMSGEMSQERQNSHQLQQVLETKVKDDMRTLGKNMETFHLALEHAKMEQGLLAEAEKQDRDALRQAHVNIELVVSEVKKANTVTNIIENRLACTAKGVQQNWAKIEEIAQHVTTLKEGHTIIKDRVGDAEAFMKQVCDGGQATNEKLEDTIRVMERTSDRLGQVQKMVDEGNMGTEELKLQMNSQRQNQEATSRRLDNMNAELKEVGRTASAVRAGLKEQSSILLPNIHMDSTEAASASARHGSLLMGNQPLTGRPGSKSSPRMQMKKIPPGAATWS